MATRTLISSKLICLLLSSKAVEAVPGEAQGPSGAQDRAKTRSGLKTFEKNTSFFGGTPGSYVDSERNREKGSEKKSRGGL